MKDFLPKTKNPETAKTEPETDEDFEKMTVAELKAMPKTITLI